MVGIVRGRLLFVVALAYVHSVSSSILSPHSAEMVTAGLTMHRTKIGFPHMKSYVFIKESG